MRQSPTTAPGSRPTGHDYMFPLPEGRAALNEAALRRRSRGERALRPCADTVAPEGAKDLAISIDLRLGLPVYTRVELAGIALGDFVTVFVAEPLDGLEDGYN